MTRKGTLRIKICGLQRLADVEAVNRCRPDWAGFVFAPGRRRICPEEARVLRAALRKDIPVFGVFVNAPVEEAAALAREGILDGIQLHGDEDAVYVDVLRHHTAVPVWQACRVRPGATDAGQRTAAAVGMIVLDAFSPAAYGGTGKRIDAALLRQVRVDRPFLLAGGLTAETVAEAVAAVLAVPCLAPYLAGVDVSGGVETNGRKDPEKIREFIETVRGMRP